MSRSCMNCNKKSQKAAHRSKALNKTLRRQNVNLQKYKGDRWCTRCIRTVAKQTSSANGL